MKKTLAAMPLKPADFGVLIPALGAVLVSFFVVYAGPGTQYAIHLKGEGGEWIFPRDAAETVTAVGPLGDTLVEIQNGAARVVSSPCANQTCVAAGIIRSRGQWAACLPNRVMVFIGDEGGSDRERPGGGGKTDVDAAVW